MSPRVEILSYFSVETDLAAAMAEWPELVSGQKYDVDLQTPDGAETVTIRFDSGDKDKRSPYVSVSANIDGDLFRRSLGFTIYALGAHSDNLQVTRHNR